MPPRRPSKTSYQSPQQGTSRFRPEEVGKSRSSVFRSDDFLSPRSLGPGVSASYARLFFGLPVSRWIARQSMHLPANSQISHLSLPTEGRTHLVVHETGPEKARSFSPACFTLWRGPRGSQKNTSFGTVKRNWKSLLGVGGDG